MSIPEPVYKINFHLSPEEGSFMYYLHEKNIFDEALYQELVGLILDLLEYGDVESYVFERYENCLGRSFISNIIHVVSYLGARLSDNRINMTVEGLEFDELWDKVNYLVEILNSLFYLRPKE